MPALTERKAFTDVQLPKKILRPSSANVTPASSRCETTELKTNDKKVVFSILDPQVPLSQKLSDYKEQNKMMTQKFKAL